jgi:DNA-binding response OmpR family regulator/anti-sigma regulatory factor (Ser/Thr protein kinase)
MISEIEVGLFDRGEPSGSVRDAVDGRRATILIVDDDLTARELMTELLEARGFQAIAVARGEEVFDWLGEIDLVLLDAMLPDRDGWSICRELKEHHDPLLPVIMVTARAAPADMVRTFDAHADDYITKPFHASELIARVRTRLRVHRMEQELREMGRRQAELAEQNFKLYQKAVSDAEERETLLRELDHRVRNNLAVIMGLATLERCRQPPRPSAQALATLENRFRAFLLVYDALRHRRYRSVPIREIAERLLQRLRNSTTSNGRVQLEITGSAADLGERQAFSLALILNELIANALEHAFPDDRTGTISLRMKDQGESVQIAVIDDGVGFPHDLRREVLGSGHSIVDALVQGDLAGRIAYDSGENGTAIVLTFPRDEINVSPSGPWGPYPDAEA